MTFLAQLDVGEFDDAGEGMVYAFVCTECRTTATSFQQT